MLVVYIQSHIKTFVANPITAFTQSVFLTHTCSLSYTLQISQSWFSLILDGRGRSRPHALSSEWPQVT